MALTFQKLRGVLHRAIADQASSLRDALGHQRGNRATALMMTAGAMAEWETFAINLHLSATSRRLPLTLSRLLGWIDLLEGYLSFVLSRHLSGSDAATPLPPGPAPALTSLTVAAIVIVLIHDSRKDAYQLTHHDLLACLLRPVRAPRRRRCRDPPTPRAGTGIDIVDGRYNRDCPHPRGDDSRKDAYQPTHHVLLACDLSKKIAKVTNSHRPNFPIFNCHMMPPLGRRKLDGHPMLVGRCCRLSTSFA